MKAGFIDNKGEYCNIPLKGISVSGKIWGNVSEITVKQVFKNEGSKNLEAVYVFPIPPGAAVTAFEARMGDSSINSFLVEKDEGYRTYDRSVRAGDSSFLLEQFGQNIFHLSIGQILSGQTVEITIEYIEDLEFSDLQLRLMIPMVVAPRYIPGCPVGHKTGPGTANPTDRVPDADYITPPIDSVDYKVAVSLTANLLRPVRVIESPSHDILVEEHPENTFKVTLKDGADVPDRDFVLLFTCVNEESSRGIIYKGEGDEGIMYMTFVPEIPPTAEDNTKNFLFLIDISGSMSGEKLEQAKNALKICIRNLSNNDTFNMIAYANKTHYFSDTSNLPFTQITLDRTSVWIDGLEAEGGTEVLGAIKHSLDPERTEDSIIILFTDGQVGNEDEVLNYVSENIGNSRIYPFGIDTAVNSYFIKKLAEVGRGKAEFIYPGERIDDKVIRQFARITSPSANEIELEWNNLKTVEVFPKRIAEVYDMEPVNILARVYKPIEGEVVFSGKSGKVKVSQSLHTSSMSEGCTYNLLEKLWARKMIEELEDMLVVTVPRRENRIREEIIKLSKKYGIMSSLTSFIAVHVRNNKVTGLPITKTIPVSLPRGWKATADMACTSLRELSSPYSTPRPQSADFVLHNPEPENQLDLPCFLTEQREHGRKAAVSLPDILRVIARNQQANGAFSNNDESDMFDKIETTALVIIALTAGRENLSLYKKQVEKAVRYLIERIVNAKVKPNTDRSSAILLKSLLAFNLCLLSGAVKEDTCELIDTMIKDIREASLSAESISGKKNCVLLYLDKHPNWSSYDTIKEIAGIVENEGMLEKRIDEQTDEGNTIKDLAKLGILKSVR
ncbi:MAG: hypothetical protein HPY66_2731 [Firmicutes bacterium]|nr:hypothetical protein [Bacillota bacterium]MDI6706110.1 VIT and VWA domain-containing protein [Bacillota bacterium]